MFAPPPEIKSTVFSRMPDKFRHPGRQTEWTRYRPQYPNLDCFLEGPAFDRAGVLHVVNIPFGQIYRISAKGDWDLVAEYDGEPNGLAFHRDGRMFIADCKWGIVVVDPRTGTMEPLLTRRNGERFKGCNDLVFSRSGDLYFTDQGQSGLNDPTGRVYRLRANGQLDCLIDNAPSPNGIALSPDELTVFVAVTRGNAVWRIPLQPDGSVNRAGLYVQLSGSLGGPDGMCMDATGALSLAHVHFGSVWGFDCWGEPAWRIRSVTGRRVTNLAYGGPDNTSLFITESETGTILRAEMPAPGLKLFSHL